MQNGWPSNAIVTNYITRSITFPPSASVSCMLSHLFARYLGLRVGLCLCLIVCSANKTREPGHCYTQPIQALSGKGVHIN